MLYFFLGRFEESMNQVQDNDISRKTTEKCANMYQPDFEAKLLICSYKYLFLDVCSRPLLIYQAR